MTRLATPASTISADPSINAGYHNFDTLSQDSFNAQSSDSLLPQSDDDDDHTSFNPRGYHTIVLDCAPVSFADSMGLAMLEQMVREYECVGIQVLLSAPTTPLCQALNRNGFFQRYSSERLFPSVATAVRYAKDGNKVVSFFPHS